ncbi:MAG TPA: alpha-N-acetylglucosaminidase TIM-barrel domain-containing protein, partial [bacterium]|nr:alpha-N-acetylglucosaminidase TIM-barrel domain-containing protein [bacterium]
EPPALQLAAQDLSAYLEKILDRKVPVRTSFPERKSNTQVFFLATSLSRTFAPSSLAPHLTGQSLDSLGPDGCKAVCAQPVLLLCGKTPRGAANAVWTYLEEYCHVGFFWDEDNVPRLDSLPFRNVAFEQKPRFAERYLSPPGGYTLSEFMDWDQWKKDIDWRVHKRQNIFYGPGGELIWKKILAEMQGGEYILSSAETWQDNLNRKIATYVRDRGLMSILPGTIGDVPAEFVAAHPNVRYLGGVRWGDAPMNKHIYPSDPMFHEISVRYAKKYIEEYGPAHFYFAPPYPEATPGESPEEQTSVKVDFANALQKVVHGISPDMIWMADSWAFLTAEFWPPEGVRAFCEAITDIDHFRIYDTWGEERPMWTLHNAFWGKKWTLGILHCFGGMTSLRGDIHSLARDINRVATDPAARQCVGIYLVPETLHHNDLFFDLAMSLAWDPTIVPVQDDRADLQPYLKDYALRRYGSSSAKRMTRVLDILARTVYATKDMAQPAYLHQMYTVLDFPNTSTYFPLEQPAQVPQLRRALEIALKEADAQRNNPLYERDLVDIARRYLGDLFNAAVPNVIHAWRAGDTERFKIAENDIYRILYLTGDLLSSASYYRLETRTEPGKSRPDYESLLTQARNVMSIWEGSANLDYVRRDDLAELIRGYYYLRTSFWLNCLREVPAAQWSQAQDDRLRDMYMDVGRRWVREGAQSLPSQTSTATTKVVRQLLYMALEAGIEERWMLRPQKEMVNTDFSQGMDGWSLSMRRTGLSFQPGSGDRKGNTVAFQTWPESSGGNFYLFQTVKASDAEISLDMILDKCGQSGFAGLRVEGYDSAFHWVAECTYQCGDSWNHWPDRYRPDNSTPDWSVGATGLLWWWVGHYTIKERYGDATGVWRHIEACPKEDFDRVHGKGTWSGLNIKTLRIALLGSTRRAEDPLAVTFANLRVKTH